MKKKKKYKLKLRNIIMMFIFIGCISYLTYYIIDRLNPYQSKYFMEIGYNTSETEFILNLDESEKDKLLEHTKIDNIIRYYTIDHYSELTQIGYSDDEITEIIEHKNDVITFVLNHSKISDLLTWLSYENFSLKYFERYLSHQTENPTFTYETIIERVNTNRDDAYYTNVKNAELNLNELILVNKYYALDEDFVPVELSSIAPYGSVKLVKVAADAFKTLCQTAENQGYTIEGISGYRSYQTQNNLYNRYLKKDPQWLVDTYSAKAGYSEHQTGLAIDVSSNNSNILTFEQSDSFKWMRDHAHEFGFILRYQKGKEDITGYKYEPWHYRYVGIEKATILYQTGMTYDEYVALNLID